MRYDTSVPEQNDLLNFIATTVETLRGQVATLRDHMATKDDLARVESQMASRIEVLRDQMATKDDLARLEGRIATNLTNLETRMATKHSLDQLELRMDTKMTAIRGDIEQVQVRLDSIDHAVSARLGTVETEISRLRSVVYLLVKDQPDMLRLLGQPRLGERPQG
jgi:hypothetical protein